MTTGGTGVASGGAVGGSINLITKHAPDVDITRLTRTYVSQSQFGGNVDISRRYGEHKEWGVKAEQHLLERQYALDRQTDEFGNVVLGVDYRGERVRAAFDVGYQADNLRPPLRFFGLGATTVIPKPPTPGLNFQVPWAYYAPTGFFTTAQGEVDLTDWMTAYAVFGYHDSNINYLYPSPTITNGATGALAGLPGRGKETFETFAGTTGIWANVDTGFIHHAMNINYSVNDRGYDQNLRASSIIAWNLYTEPTNIPPPANFNGLAITQRTGVRLSSVGLSDTMSMLNDRVQFTVGARHQTASTEVTNFLAPASSWPEISSSVWSPGLCNCCQAGRTHLALCELYRRSALLWPTAGRWACWLTSSGNYMRHLRVARRQR